MEEEKLDYRSIIEGILTDEPFFNQIRQKLFDEDEDTRIIKLTDAIYFFEVLNKSGPGIDEFLEVLPLCDKEEQYELIYRFVDCSLPQLNTEQDVIDDTKEYLLSAYDTEEILKGGFATISDSVYSKWTKKQRTAYDEENYENIPRVGSEAYEWNEDELFRFRYYDAADLAYGMDIMTVNYFGGFDESESTSYFYMSDLDMQGQVGIDSHLDSAIHQTFYYANKESIKCMEDLAKFFNSKNLHDKLHKEVPEKEAPITKAQQLSDDIENEDFSYKTPTTKSHRNKL